MSPLKPESLVKGLEKLAKAGCETELWWWHYLGIGQLTSTPTQLNKAEGGQIPTYSIAYHVYIYIYIYIYISFFNFYTYVRWYLLNYSDYNVELNQSSANNIQYYLYSL